MEVDPKRAALWYLLSVAFFAAASHLTARLVPHTSVTVIMGLRTFVGSTLLWLIVLAERKIALQVFLSKYFWLWTLMFTITVLFYGVAFTSPSIDDVLIIAALMPLAVIAIDYVGDRSTFRRQILPPALLMFAAAALPSAYKLWRGQSELVLSFATGFAFVAMINHAIWLVLGRSVQKRAGGTSEAARAAVMFTLGWICLGGLSEFNVIQELEKGLRGRIFRTNFLHYAEDWEYWTLTISGLCSAATVFCVTRALKRDRPSNVISYHYSLAVWTFFFSLLDPLAPSQQVDTRIVTAITALTIAAGSYWLYRSRDSGHQGGA